VMSARNTKSLSGATSLNSGRSLAQRNPLTPRRDVCHSSAPRMRTRAITRADYQQIVSVIDHWWAGPTSALAHPLFFYELGRHAVIAEEDGSMVGFLLGFMSDTEPRVGYIHLVGIDPDFRRRGVGKALYAEFESQARAAGASALKAITTPGNQGSVEFHRALGYTATLEADYAGAGRARHVFRRDLQP
jgi:ribosomal protein S18 acetylase RimI-like enzyme